MTAWLPGRQGTGYRKFILSHGRRWDLHLIDYPCGIGIPVHTDPLPGRRHLRVNVALMTGGSRLWTAASVLRVGERLVAFWSDQPHSVSSSRRRRMVLSLGLSLPGWL